MTHIRFADRVAGSIFGSAYGDAAGRTTEFISSVRTDMHTVSHFERRLRADLFGAKVTDDTMMMLAVGRAALAALPDPLDLAGELISEYVAWAEMPQAGRSPGATCMQAVRGLARHPFDPWQAHSVINSKGCGANMRVQPLAFVRTSAEAASGMAQLSAAITHGHPTALAAADLTAIAIRWLAAGQALDASLINRLAEYAFSQRTVYRSRWLGSLSDRAGALGRTTPRRWISRGWDELLSTLGHVQQALTDWNGRTDPCTLTGEGWVADEALGTALLLAIRCGNWPVEALARAALTRGDSDSLACITGALIGAAHGIGAWPAAWRIQIEFANELEELSAGLAARR